MQVDATMNQGEGWSQTPWGTEDAVAEDKNVDQVELAVSMGLGENGKVAFAHITHDSNLDSKVKTNFIAGEYSIGSMTAYLGFNQKKLTNSNPAVIASADDDDIPTSVTDKETYAGIRGSVGDTGVSYVFQAISKKSKGKVDTYENGSQNSEEDVDTNKHTPWMISLSRSLGGGATVVFEHSNPDSDSAKSQSALALMVGF